MIKWDEKIKQKARELRRQGSSYSQIRSIINVPKSTLHCWVSDLGPSPHQSSEARAERFRQIQRLGALANKNKKEEQLREIIQRCKDDVSLANWEDKIYLKSLLSMLYWAEGAKYDGNGSVNFVNTDPKLALLFLTLFRKSFEINEDKLRLRLHLHYYHNISESKRFWSELLGIPISQFGKIYIKKRSKTKRFRKNFMGICFIIYHDVKLLRYIMNFGLELSNKINNRSL